MVYRIRFIMGPLWCNARLFFFFLFADKKKPQKELKKKENNAGKRWPNVVSVTCKSTVAVLAAGSEDNSVCAAERATCQPAEVVATLDTFPHICGIYFTCPSKEEKNIWKGDKKTWKLRSHSFTASSDQTATVYELAAASRSCHS